MKKLHIQATVSLILAIISISVGILAYKDSNQNLAAVCLLSSMITLGSLSPFYE